MPGPRWAGPASLPLPQPLPPSPAVDLGKEGKGGLHMVEINFAQTYKQLLGFILKQPGNQTSKKVAVPPFGSHVGL